MNYLTSFLVDSPELETELTVKKVCKRFFFNHCYPVFITEIQTIKEGTFNLKSSLNNSQVATYFPILTNYLKLNSSQLSFLF